MPPLAIALLSGGLDSKLAIRLMQQQGVAIEALAVRTQFSCCQDQAARAAAELGVPLTIAAPEDDYIEIIKKPRHGYGRGANPCVDCRVYMFRKARRLMEQLRADMVISGEVLGQRPMSQKRRDLMIVARESGLDDRLLRPLSARRLPPTWPEEQGLVDRARLCDFVGRSRKGLIALARRLGIEHIPSPSTGCALTEPSFARRVHDLVQLDAAASRWDFDLLRLGRHVRFDEQTKVVVGRREAENLLLEQQFAAADARASLLLRPADFQGPTAMVVGPATDEAVALAAALVVRYAGQLDDAARDVWLIDRGNNQRRFTAVSEPAALTAAPL